MINRGSRDVDKKSHDQSDQQLIARAINELKKREVISNDDLGQFNTDNSMTTERFVEWIIKSHEDCLNAYQKSAQLTIIEYALNEGLIEDYDVVNLQSPIERRQAARIVHEMLRSFFAEADENNWAAAKQLDDLYSCRTCVQHVAQVYVKGIINAKRHKCFELNDSLTHAEAAIILLKMMDPSFRNPKTEEKTTKHQDIEPEKAKRLLSKSSTLLLDVRTIDAYTKSHLAGSIHFPLEKMMKNAKIVGAKRDTPIILYCQKGYRSRLAADELRKSGYTQVYTLPGLDQYPYSNPVI